MAIAFPADATEGQEYTFEGTTYAYDQVNNRWIAQASGGGSITVSETRPDPASGAAGDLWWYCGADGEDPGLFTLIADTNGGQHWIQSSPGVAFNPILGGGGGGADLPLFSFSEGAVSVGVAVTNTYTVPYTGTYRMILVGAGGTGWVSDTGGSLNVGAGGGAGFAMIHAMALEAGDTISYALAARVENSGRDSTGSAAGDSSVSINGTEVMTAAGGGAGGIGVGGPGGAATGGDFRLAGSVGGTGNPASTGGNGGMANIATNGGGILATYLGNLIGGYSGNGGRGTTNGTSTGHAAYFGIQGSGMTN